MKTIGIIGSRRKNAQEDFNRLWNTFLTVYEPGDKIVSGGCPLGGDRFAELIAEKYNLTLDNGLLIIHYADWDQYGKQAGFIRNTYIAEDADIIIALVADDRKGGTEDTLKKAMKLHKQILII